jgi:hypothetical protein
MCKDGRTNVHNEEQSARLSAVSDDFVQSSEQKVCERWHITISELSCECPQMSCSVLYDTITSFAQDGFQKCSWVHTKHREWLPSALTFFRAIPQRWR